MAEDEQSADVWGPDDAEIEQWLEEWAEVDRSAAEYLDEAMDSMGWESLPGPDLDRASAALRAGAASDAGNYQYFVAALGGSPDDRARLARSSGERWLAREIPALGGLTPRAAAAGDRRADLEALLEDFEWTQREHPQPADMDLDRVRRDLGLA